MPAIEARGLTKRFRVAAKSPGLAGAAKHLLRPRFEVKTAVDHIDLRIEPGEMVGYVGPNGAGKSTTVKMLTGILVPSEGEVRVGGLVPHRRRIENARRIGAVFGQRTQLWWDLPVQEWLCVGPAGIGRGFRVAKSTAPACSQAAIAAMEPARITAWPATGASGPINLVDPGI